MSHPITFGNGCTLEDCHTNLFALTDLDGIKWRKLSAQNTCFADPLEDPVLQSFTRCIQSDILCVWRRVQTQSNGINAEQTVPDQLSCSKELWIFWYGDEPYNLSNLLSQDLQEREQGSWANGLSYECRTLLYKALHNLIERCLMSQNFIRIGKWFVQPYHHYGNCNPDKSAHLSIQFSFFLHGESTVCASIDIRQHPPLCRMHLQYLAYAQQMAAPNQGAVSGIPVILAPYGLAATLTGQSFRETDLATQRLLDDWRQFYMITEPEGSEASKVPSVVEVIVAGVRMRYPSSFVLVTAETDTEIMRHQTSMLPASGAVPCKLSVTIGTPSASPVDVELPSKLECGSSALQPLMEESQSAAVSKRIVEKVWEDCVSCGQHGQHSRLHQSNQHQHQQGTADDPAAIGVWDFSEPLQRNPCSCCRSKQRAANTSHGKVGVPFAGKHATAETSEKTEKSRHATARNVSSFHQRSTASVGMIRHDVDMSMEAAAVNALNSKAATNALSGSGGLPALRNGVFEQQSVDSPHSAAPSPLMVPQIQPSTSHNGDPTMPTLSPHPPPAKHPDKDASNGPGDLHDAGLATTTNVGVVSAPVSVAESADTEPKSEGFLSPPYSNGTPGGGVGVKTEAEERWLDVQQQQRQPARQERRPVELLLLKRPLLPTNSYDDDTELITESLYDFKALDSWLQHSVKRPKQDPDFKSGQSPVGGHGHSKWQDNTPSPQLHPHHDPHHDPYEFSDEASSNAGSFRKRAFRNSTSRDDSFTRAASFTGKEDDARRNSDASGNFKDFNKSSLDVSPPMPATAAAAAAQQPTSLMREIDLVPTLDIPDKLFESESENSDSEALQIPSPGTGMVKMADDVSKTSASKMCISSAVMMGPTTPELSRMFPTPPSLENQQNALSPGQTADMMATDVVMCAMPQTVMTDVDIARTEAFNSAVKPGQTEDWSYVNKPPTVSMFVRADKYAPITLPSARLPSLGVEGLLYKPSCQPFHMMVMDKHPQPPPPYTNVLSVDNIASVGSVPRSHADRPDLSPAAAGLSYSQQRTPRTPMSYELQSPASNASSYLNKNMSSVDNHPTNSFLPEVHSLVTNVMLSDSILNLFKDHNFNSCAICVCNMNIDGTDVGLYLPHTSSEPQYKCTCGFSAVMNRKDGVNSGLFYEDEVDITGIRDERLEHRKPSLLVGAEPVGVNHRTNPNATPNAEVVPQDIMALLQGQFSTLYPSCTVLHNYRKTHTALEVSPSDQLNKLEIQDGCDVCYGALELGRQAVDNCNSTRLEDILLKDTCLHKWPYLTTAAKVPNNTQDMVRLLKSLQPLLQDAIQKKRSSRLWEAVYTITGPLSWKDFHLLSGRGSDETSEPQPIPPLLLGSDREWLTLDPHVVRYWDKLMLESHGRSRNIAYVVVAPENDYVLQCTKAFFKELTTMYEFCHLGRHQPISKILRDGIMRVGKTAATKLSEEPVDDWFKLIGNSLSAAKLKLYARVCQHHLAPFLSQEIVEKKLPYDAARDSVSKVTPPSHPTAASPVPPSHPGGDRSLPQHPSSLFQSQQHSHSEEKTGDTHDSRLPTHSEIEGDPDAADRPAYMVYMVDPFSYASDADDLRRLAMLGLLRCFNEMLKTLPNHVHENIHLQIVPLHAILEFGETPSQQYMKGLALSVYTQCRRLLIHSLLGRPLTSFGPAAGNTKILKSEPTLDRLINMRLYMPPFTLALSRNIPTSQLAISDHQDNCRVLLCGYCLSEDQRWLLAVCTDSVGSILETRTINIDIPNRNRRKNVSARKIGLSKLWDFLLGVMSSTTLSWRLVIGRFGRLGHGELKGWAGLLSRKHLQQGCKQLKEMCVTCGSSGNNDAPYIVSACLVSLEVHPTIHIMTDSVKVEEKQSSDCPMSTPKDASCTHILVFPTSALAQANQPVNHQEHPIDLSTEDIFSGLVEFDGPDIDVGPDIFSMSPDGSPKNNSAPGSPSHAAGSGMPMMNGACKGGGSGTRGDVQDEEHNLLQQPLAMGFYLSTASTGQLPKWFWGRCPEREDVCPTCFKAALHIHCPAVQQNTDEFLQTPHKHNHPLDSSLTCDVLRYVLEMYNALSWLTIDPVTDDRRSCLPAHLVVLMQLYHAMRAFV